MHQDYNSNLDNFHDHHRIHQHSLLHCQRSHTHHPGYHHHYTRRIHLIQHCHHIHRRNLFLKYSYHHNHSFLQDKCNTCLLLHQDNLTVSPESKLFSAHVMAHVHNVILFCNDSIQISIGTCIVPSPTGQTEKGVQAS